jgi:WD40 repeat protein
LKRRLLASPDARAAGLEVFLDRDDLTPGSGWRNEIEQVITARSTAFAVIVGTRGLGNWVEREVDAALARATRDKAYLFIPVFHDATAMSLSLQDASTSLPPFARQYHGVCDPINDEKELAKLLRAVLGDAVEEDGAGRRRSVRLTAPFVGLRAMTEADADRFFGREEELDALVETLRANRLVAIIADSGSGKSSLAQAGLIPRIRGGALEDTSREAPDGRAWQVVVMRPGSDPVDGLRRGVTEAAERLGLDGAARAALRQRIDPARVDPGARAEWVYALQCELPAAATATVLIVDQFEELLTQTPLKKRQPFVDWLMDITSEAAAIPVRAVLTIRADYFNLCSAHAAFYERIKPDGHVHGTRGAPPARRSAHFRLKALTAAASNGAAGRLAGSHSYTGLAAIVHRPLILAGRNDEAQRNALLTAIRYDVSDRPGDLALVQMALYETWRESKGGQEDLFEAYSRIGGMAGALAYRAEEVRTRKLIGDEAGLLEAVLVRLVSLGGTGGATRRAARRGEFDLERRKLAEKLTTEEYGRLLLARGDSFEICHEHLITQWPWWQNYLNAAAQDVQSFARLMAQAADWSIGGKTWRDLATGEESELFNNLVIRRRGWLSDIEVAFMKAMAQRKRILLYGMYVWGTALLFVVMLALFVTWDYYVARHQPIVNESLALSDAAIRALSPNDVFKLALAAWPRSASDPRPRLWRSVQALSRATASPLTRLPEMRHDGEVNGAVFDKSESRILSWSDDGTVRLWDAATGQTMGAALEHDDAVHGAVFDRLESRILSWSDDGTVRLWDVATGHMLGKAMRHDSAVYGAVFDRSEGRILSWSDDGTVRLWDAATGQALGSPMKHGGAVYGAVFDKSEGRILSWSDDGTIRLWDVATKHALGEVMKHVNAVHGAVFDKSEGRVLSWSDDGTIRLWDVTTGHAPGETMKHISAVNGAVFDKSEGRILSWSDDGTIRLWNAVTGQALVAPIKHGNRVYGALFDTSEGRILSWSRDGVVRLWDAANGHALGAAMRHVSAVRGAIFDKSESRVLSWSVDGTVRLWNAATGRALGVAMKHDGAIYGAVFDRSEGRILSWAGDGAVRLWDAPSASMKHDAQVNGAVYGRSESRILSWSDDGTVRLWDAATGRALGAPMKHDGAIYGAVFDKSEGRILSWSDDGTIRLWDAVTQQRLGEQLKHDGTVRGAVFDRSERRILSWSDDGTIRLWDANTLQSLGTPMKHDGAVQGARFDKSEGRILSWSDDGTIRLWDAITRQTLGGAMKHDGAVKGAVFDVSEGRILSWSDDGTVRLWDAVTRQLLGMPMKHDGMVNGAAFDKSEGRILSWSDDGGRLWDANLHMLVLKGSVKGALFDETGGRILSWSDGSVWLRDLRTKYALGPMQQGGDVLGAVLSRSERRILSWSKDGTIRLWDAATGQPIGALMKHEKKLTGATFNKSETRILSWSDDGTIRQWDVSRLMQGNLIEVACRLLADKDVSTLEYDYNITVTDPICANGGRDAPAPDINSLRD